MVAKFTSYMTVCTAHLRVVKQSCTFFSRRGYLYWSEGIGDAMYRSAMDGTNIETLLNTSTEVVGELIDFNLVHSECYSTAVNFYVALSLNITIQMTLQWTGLVTISIGLTHSMLALKSWTWTPDIVEN